MALVFIAVALCGCIEVKNFGGFWAEAQVDSELVGHWRSTDGFTCEITLSGQNLTMRETIPDAETQRIFEKFIPPGGWLVKTLTHHGEKFLLVKTAEGAEGGTLRRYTLTEKNLTFFVFDDHTLEQGIRSGVVQGTIRERIPYDPKKEGVPNPLTALPVCTISVLTTDALEFLLSEKNAKHWSERTYVTYRAEETQAPGSEPKRK